MIAVYIFDGCMSCPYFYMKANNMRFQSKSIVASMTMVQCDDSKMLDDGQ